MGEVTDPSAAVSAAHGDPLRVLADVPIERDADDRLGFGAYADALAELLDHPATSTPLTVAVTGPWGSGKTSLARMVADRLHRWPAERGEPPHIVCWFNAWLHGDAANPGAAFAAEVARVAGRHRPWAVRVLRPLPGRILTAGDRWRRRLLLTWLSLMPVAAVVLWSALHGEDDLRQALGLSQAAGLVALPLAVVTLCTNLASMADTAGRFFRDPAGEAGRGTVNEVRSQLAELVAQATGGRRRLVIFVDDLERCEPGRAVEICEKAHQLFGHRDVAVVLIADAAALASAAGKHHGDGDYGRRYLEKLVQIQFGLPPAGPAAIRVLLQGPEEPAPPTIALTPAPTGFRRLFTRPWRWAGAFFALTAVNVVAESILEGRVSAAAYTAFDTWSGLVAFLQLASGVVAVVTSTRKFLARTRSREERALIDQKIEDLATGSETRAGELADEVRRATAAPAPLVENRVQRYLVDTSDARRQAEAELLRHPPTLPRDAKRMLNQLRVQLAVALRQGALGDDALTAARLGRRVVLQYRWPTVARASAPELARLEACSTVGDLRAALAGPVDDPGELLAFLHENPRLSDAFDDYSTRRVSVGAQP